MIDKQVEGKGGMVKFDRFQIGERQHASIHSVRRHGSTVGECIMEVWQQQSSSSNSISCHLQHQQHNHNHNTNSSSNHTTTTTTTEAAAATTTTGRRQRMLTLFPYSSSGPDISRCSDRQTSPSLQPYLVLATVSERKLLGRAPGRQPHQLVPHADAEDGLDIVTLQGDYLFHLLDRRHAHRRVSRPIGQENSVELALTPWNSFKNKGTGRHKHVAVINNAVAFASKTFRQAQKTSSSSSSRTEQTRSELTMIVTSNSNHKHITGAQERKNGHETTTQG